MKLIFAVLFVSWRWALHLLYKMLSYRRETALQGTLVLAESGRLELKRQYFTDIVSLASTTVT